MACFQARIRILEKAGHITKIGNLSRAAPQTLSSQRRKFTGYQLNTQAAIDLLFSYISNFFIIENQGASYRLKRRKRNKRKRRFKPLTVRLNERKCVLSCRSDTALSNTVARGSGSNNTMSNASSIYTAPAPGAMDPIHRLEKPNPFPMAPQISDTRRAWWLRLRVYTQYFARTTP